MVGNTTFKIPELNVQMLVMAKDVTEEEITPEQASTGVRREVPFNTSLFGKTELRPKFNTTITLENRDNFNPEKLKTFWESTFSRIVSTNENMSEKRRNAAESAASKFAAESEAKQKAAEEAKRKAEQEEAERIAKEEEEIEAKRKAAEEAERKVREAAEQRRKAEEEAKLKQQEEEAQRKKREAEEEAARLEAEKLKTISDEDLKMWVSWGIFQTGKSSAELKTNNTYKQLYMKICDINSEILTKFNSSLPNIDVADNLMQVFNNVNDYINEMIKVNKEDKTKQAKIELEQYKELLLSEIDLTKYYIYRNTLISFIKDVMDIKEGRTDKVNEIQRKIDEIYNSLSSDINIKTGNQYVVNSKDLYTQIVDTNEKVLGQARVIVVMRDDFREMEGGFAKFNENLQKFNEDIEKPDTLLKPIAKKNEGEPCVSAMQICDKIARDGTNKFEGQCYGVFRNVFVNAAAENVFDDEFEQSKLIENTIMTGGNLMAFGFGFSGSGKTYLLLGDKEHNILKRTIEYLSKKNLEGVEVTFEELYPVADKDGNFVVETYNEEQKALAKHNANFKEDMFLKDFREQFDSTTQKRISKLRIAPTPNNPESSRSHMFIVVKFNFQGGNSGKLTLVDMAGSENTIEIKQLFLVTDKVKDDEKPITYKYTTAKELYTTYLRKNVPYDIYSIFTEHNSVGYFRMFNALILSPQDSKYKVGIEFETTFIKKRFAQPNIFGEKAFLNAQNGFKSLLTLTFIEIDHIFAKLDFNINSSSSKEVKKISHTSYPLIINTFLNKMKDTYKLSSEKLSSEKLSSEKYVDDSTDFNNIKYDTTHYDSLLNDLDLRYLINPEVIKLYLGKIIVYDNIIINNTADIPIKKPRRANQSTPPPPPPGKAYISNPFMVIFFTVENILREILSTIDKNKDKALILYHTILLKVILAYVNLIVKQGKGIVTTLEHLKYVFLYRTSSHIGIHKYNSQYPNRAFNGSELVEKSRTYTVEKSVHGDTVEETVEMGNMKQTQMIRQLVKYSMTGNIYDLDKQLTYESENLQFGPDKYNVVKLPLSDNSKFVMFAAIMRGFPVVNDQGELEYTQESNKQAKYCGAMRDTLEFAKSITSGIGECRQCSISSAKSGGHLKTKDRTSKRRGHRGGKRSKRNVRGMKVVNVYAG
jgi:flagellar biosynthesis GTPase FlhF